MTNSTSSFVRLIQQDSKTLCVPGVTFGGGNGKMWVHNCRGVFQCHGATLGPNIACGYPPGKRLYHCDCDGPPGTNGAVARESGPQLRTFGVNSRPPWEDPYLLTVALQYFNMSWNIRLLERWKGCEGVELLVNVDSRFDGDLEWLSTSADHVIFSSNIHEIRAYNKMARMARADLIAFVQDDRAPPIGCEYLSHLRQMFATDRTLAVVGMNIATNTPWNYGNHIRYTHPARWWHGGGFKAEYAACVDIGPLVARKRDFFAMGMFDSNFSPPGRGGIGLDFDLSMRAWLSNRSVAMYHADSLPGIVRADGVVGRKKAAYYIGRSHWVHAYVKGRFDGYRSRYDWIVGRVKELNGEIGRVRVV